MVNCELCDKHRCLACASPFRLVSGSCRAALCAALRLPGVLLLAALKRESLTRAAQGRAGCPPGYKATTLATHEDTCLPGSGGSGGGGATGATGGARRIVHAARTLPDRLAQPVRAHALHRPAAFPCEWQGVPAPDQSTPRVRRARQARATQARPAPGAAQARPAPRATQARPAPGAAPARPGPLARPAQARLES
jgi:hypothetical protein